jgi:hypothetical protein
MLVFHGEHPSPRPRRRPAGKATLTRGDHAHPLTRGLDNQYCFSSDGGWVNLELQNPHSTNLSRVASVDSPTNSLIPSTRTWFWLNLIFLVAFDS